MLSREELLHLFDRFSVLISQPDVKKRIADAVNDNQEAVAVTTAIQEEILKEMGVDPTYGLSCLGKIGMEYENDQDLMVRFYRFVATYVTEDLYSELIWQLEMLKHMRNYGADDQSAILEKLRQKMEKDFENEASLLSVEEIKEIVETRA
ncbi:hypothetical protein E3N88_41907 [Mikania micrantha]|uniref:Uncharacterized protein n=1 Tax=Mikania micrantha TaxID=192012 RepID=A0A5N6LJC3_9ASTR|nr:hypothetical protein E3N88_41907 [Mikania micrantha]